mmetsp:Transcript_79090/g.115873  ORF Transcript_79090/g.115873 Transcript_79090/m.115873 type:complete len:209 (+) Transcript_79090:210-836(+)
MILALVQAGSCKVQGIGILGIVLKLILTFVFHHLVHIITPKYLNIFHARHTLELGHDVLDIFWLILALGCLFLGYYWQVYRFENLGYDVRLFSTLALEARATTLLQQSQQLLNLHFLKRCLELGKYLLARRRALLLRHVSSGGRCGVCISLVLSLLLGVESILFELFKIALSLVIFAVLFLFVLFLLFLLLGLGFLVYFRQVHHPLHL